MYQKWLIDYAGISVRLTPDERPVLIRSGIQPQDLGELTAGLI